jgi:hypothetical protein
MKGCDVASQRVTTHNDIREDNTHTMVVDKMKNGDDDDDDDDDDKSNAHNSKTHMQHMDTHMTNCLFVWIHMGIVLLLLGYLVVVVGL